MVNKRNGDFIKLFAWQKHTIFIVLTFVLGFFFLNYLKFLNLISLNMQISFNLLLNMLAMAYALYMFRLYDIAKEKTLSSIFGRCIQKG
jgi:hypothetical protein